MIKTLGIRAHDYGKMPSDKLAKAVSADGLGSIQLAINKAIEGIDNIDDDISESKLLQIGKDFKEAHVDVAVLGCYLNYAHPDKAIRNKNLGVFKQHIAYARKLQARVVGTETGSMMPDYSYSSSNHSEEAYKIFAGSLYELLETAEDLKVDLAIEGVWNHIIYSNEQLNRLIKDMNSSRLQIILDPVNLLNINNYKDHDDIIKESFQLFGDRILIVHAKDYQVHQDSILEVSHGTGRYDYHLLMNLIKESSLNIDILLENAEVSNIDQIKQLFYR